MAQSLEITGEVAENQKMFYIKSSSVIINIVNICNIERLWMENENTYRWIIFMSNGRKVGIDHLELLELSRDIYLINQEDFEVDYLQLETKLREERDRKRQIVEKEEEKYRI